MKIATENKDFTLRAATSADAALILSFIKELAEYEKLSHEVVATEESLQSSLFGTHSTAEVIIGEYKGEAVAFALFFHNFSTFLGKAGIYLEDLYVRQEQRGKGFGKILLSYLAHLACEHGCGRLEWSVLDWNEPAISFYRSIGAEPMDEWTVNRLSGQALEAAGRRFK